MLSDGKIIDNYIKITDLLEQIEREGVNDYIKYLENSDFFEAPASTKFHRSYPGGLAEHCLNLLEPLRLSNSRLIEAKRLPEDSLTIVALCHDVCKEGLYLGGFGNYYSKKGHPASNKHATVSIERIEKYIQLTSFEKDIILYHMGLFSCYGYCIEYTPKELKEAIDRHPLVQIFAAIDMEESNWYR